MTLTRRIGLVVSLLLLLLLAGVLGLYFVKSKEFYQKELAKEAQRTVHSLVESIKPVLDDRERVEAIVNQAFRQGDFAKIELIDIKTDTPIVRKTGQGSDGEVPRWFVEALSIPVPTIETIVEGPGEHFAKLRVRPDETKIYRQLYELFLYTVVLFVLFGVAGLITLALVLKVVLRSLEAIQKQAEGVIHNRFIIQKELPSTVELKNVVLAMNSMVKRVKELYNRSSSAMRESQELLYIDHATDLYNRRFFQLKLPEYLLANDTRSRGALVMMRMNGIVEGNKKIGRQKMDELLLKFAKILKQETELVHEPLLARVNGTEFAMILPVYNEVTARDLVQKIVSQFMLLADTYGLRETLYLSVGLCEYARQMQPSQLLGCVDSALSEAALYHENHIVAYQVDDANRIAVGKSQWRDIITKALKEGRFKPRLLPVHDLKRNREVLHLLTFDIVHEQKVIRYGDYVPAVVELGMEYDLMNFEFDYMKKHRFVEEGIAFEMIADMLQQSDKLFIFEDNLKEIVENLNGRLFVEISEHAILSLEPIVVEHVSKALKKYGVRFGINRFSGERGEYGYLTYSAPAYVKMDESSYLDLDLASKNALLTMLGSLDIDLIIVNVHAENIPTLRSSAIRYIMYR